MKFSKAWTIDILAKERCKDQQSVSISGTGTYLSIAQIDATSTYKAGIFSWQ